jgi:hypothetical protein
MPNVADRDKAERMASEYEAKRREPIDPEKANSGGL